MSHVMSRWKKWIGVAVVVLGAVVVAQYVGASVRHHAPTAATAAIAPEELIAPAGTLPVTVIDSYF